MVAHHNGLNMIMCDSYASYCSHILLICIACFMQMQYLTSTVLIASALLTGGVARGASCFLALHATVIHDIYVLCLAFCRFQCLSSLPKLEPSH
jgi:hypothetical protein